MSDFEFGDGHSINELPHSARLRRLARTTAEEAITAKDVGRAYDEPAERQEEILTEDNNWPSVGLDDRPVSAGELMRSGDQDIYELLKDNPEATTVDLEKDVRHFFVASGDVLDAGSVDGAIIDELGVDVCVSQELLAMCLEEAKRMTGKDKPLVHDIVVARRNLEIEFMVGEQTRAALDELKTYGIDEDELIKLFNENPFKLRSYARLLQAPLLGEDLARMKARAYRRQEAISLDDFMLDIKLCLGLNDSLHAALSEGDPEAENIIRRRLQNKKMAPAITDMVIEASENDRLPSDFPDLDERFRDIPRFE
ncbi:MAG TPA: hypothetical protein VMT23_02415 [Candidatus Binatia bacterium]|nr:hypothetical protein [Candidatus Binatia bacterium]